MRIAVFANTTWYLYNFRLNLIRTLVAAGHEVVAVGPADRYIDKLAMAGIRHRAIPLAGASINPLRELGTVWALYQVLREEGVEMVLSDTPKGNIYGAMAATMNGIKIMPNVSGLGRVFIRPSPLTRLVKLLYRFSFGRAARVFFQNAVDFDLFVRSGLVDARKAILIPGLGVDLAKFSPTEEALARPPHTPAQVPAMGSAGQMVFLLVARLLWDKGVGEFVAAARRVRQKHPTAEFRLLGFLDAQNPSAIPRSQVDAWAAEGVIRYMGSTDDVLPYLRDADCVVLPSYREGCPRTLLEAAAVAKPIITTDAPGCRDTVDDNVTGFLCRLRDADDLADKIEQIISLTPEGRVEMGKRGREKIEREFDERVVIDAYFRAIAEVCGTRSSQMVTSEHPAR